MSRLLAGGSAVVRREARNSRPARFSESGLARIARLCRSANYWRIIRGRARTTASYSASRREGGRGGFTETICSFRIAPRPGQIRRGELIGNWIGMACVTVTRSGRVTFDQLITVGIIVPRVRAPPRFAARTLPATFSYPPREHSDEITT